MKSVDKRPMNDTSSQNLHQIVYISSATEKLSEAELANLLESSRKRNKARKITGLLLVADGNIMGILEGPEEKLKRLSSRISVDDRHKNMQVIWSRSKSKRDFPDYQLAFKKTSRKSLLNDHPGMNLMFEKTQLALEEIENMSKEVEIFVKTFIKSTHYRGL